MVVVSMAAAASVAAAVLVDSAELLISEEVSVDFTHRALRSRVRALAWELAEAELDSVWVATHHINQRLRHQFAQLQADQRVRLRVLVRLRAS